MNKLILAIAKPQYAVFAQRMLKDATITIRDGGGHSVTCKIGEGNLTWTENRSIEYTTDRGLIDEVREGDEVPMSVSFQFVWLYVESLADVTIEDAIKGTATAESAGWITSDDDECRPYAIDLELAYDPDCTTNANETLTFPDFRWEQLEHDAKASTVSCSGKCNAKTPTRS